MNDLTRRAYLNDMGLGFGSLALATMLHGDGFAADPIWSPPDGKPHHPPRAKSVIWLFMVGGVSHIETFDPKPALNKYAGKTISETPYRDALESPYLANRRRERAEENGSIRTEIFPLQVGWWKHGASGLEISDWLAAPAAPRTATAATTTPMALPSGWPEAGSREASPTDERMKSASTPSRIAITSRTSTPRCSTNSAWTRIGWLCPAACGWRRSMAT
jgi:hypothetical protein